MFDFFENVLRPQFLNWYSTGITIMIMSKRTKCQLKTVSYCENWSSFNHAMRQSWTVVVLYIWSGNSINCRKNQHTSPRYTNLVEIMMAKKGNGKRSPETTRSSWFFATPPRGVELHEKDAAVLNQKWGIEMQKCVSK